MRHDLRNFHRVHVQMGEHRPIFDEKRLNNLGRWDFHDVKRLVLLRF
jgi:hypothetical protein